MDELEVISRVETKIVLASSDEKLSTSLDIYLQPLLLKLSSTREDSRQKVLSVLEHINTRLSAKVVLPAQKLLELSVSQGAESPLTKNTAASFFIKAVQHTSAIPWVNTIALNLDALESASKFRASLLFKVFLRGLVEWYKGGKTPELVFGEAVPTLSKKFTSLLLWDVVYRDANGAPGLNHDDFLFLRDATLDLTGTDLMQVKIATLNFLETSGWPVDLKFIPLFVATADRLDDISGNATGQLRRMGQVLDDQLALKVYGLAVGRDGARPASRTLQLKALDILSRSPSVVPQDPSALLLSAFESGDSVFFYHAVKLVRALASTRKDSSSGAGVLADHAEDWSQRILQNLTSSGAGYDQGSSSQDISSRQQAYETIGILQRVIIPKNLAVVRFLFERLDSESPSSTTSIQEALGEILNGVSLIPEDLLPDLKVFLKGVLESAKRDATKYMALRYAVMAFSFSDSEARVLCLLGLDPQNRSDVQEEARKGIHPYLYEKTVSAFLDETEVKLPAFSDLLETVQQANLSAAAPQIFDAAILLLSRVLINEASPVRIDAEWSKVTDAAPLYEHNIRHTVSELLDRTPTSPKLFEYCVLALSSNLEAYQQAPKVWQMLIKTASSDFLHAQNAKLPDLVKLLDGRFGNVAAESVARICPLTAAEGLVAELLPLSNGKAAAMAYFFERMSLSGLSISSETLEKLVDYCKVNKLNDPLFHLACGGLLQHNDEFVDYLKSSKDEKAMLTLGAMGLSNPDKAEVYMHTLLEQTPAQDIDTLLANGEALSICVSGWGSSSLDHDLAPPQVAANVTLVDSLIKEIFENCKKTEPALRRSSCVRLLCLVQFSTSHVKPYFPDIQAHLLRFLSSSDDVTQEAASRGLGIVYEQSDEVIKARLVERLVSSFTSEQSSRRAMAGTVSDDTQLFEPGVLSTGDGSISTYKDVLNLASEVGDSTLVYKFMSLAASSKIWSSRRGVAFGLETIMAKADFDTAGLARRKLVPKLFRYIFDPNTKVREAMQSIWNVLVPDRRKTILEHLDGIAKELLEGSHSKEWRVREASTRGLSNLVETLEWRYLESSALDLWQMAFRLLDDIKESVRKAGLDLTKALASVLVRRLQTKSESNSSLLSALIPFLTGPRGLQSESEDVRVFTMDTLMKIAKSNSEDFKPFKLQFISDFTLLLSTIEPQAMNYLALNAGNYGVDSNAIDESRMRGLSRSPVMETLEALVDRLDSQELAAYMNEIPRIVKNSVGLPSKLASARLVISVCMRFPKDTNPAPILKALMSQLADRNDLVSQTFAAAAGYVCRLVSLPDAVNYVNFVKGGYFAHDAPDRDRLHAAIAMSSLSKHASDVFNNIGATTLPFVFVGSFDSDKDTAQVFKDVWSANTGGDGSIELYASEIMALAGPHLTSAAWHLREGAAKSIGKAASYLKTPDEATLNNLLVAMGGRTWTGKEHVFDALLTVSLLGTTNIDAVNEKILVEIKRRDLQYRVKILALTGKFLEKYPNERVYVEFFDAISSILAAEADDDEENTVSETQKLELLESMVLSYNPNYSLEGKVESLLMAALVGWKFKIAVCQHMAKLGKSNFFSEALWKRTCEVCASDYAHEAVRLEWVRSAAALRDFGISGDVQKLMKDEPSTIISSELKKHGFC